MKLTDDGHLEDMDAIELLTSDHAKVNELFEKFEAAGPRALKTKQNLVAKIISELSVHASIEEQLFYPAVRSSIPDLEDDVLEAIEEHHIVKWTLSELEGLAPTEENFSAKVTVLIENVRHHVEEEESEVFPQVRRALSSEALEDLGAGLAAAKKASPTHPHPRSPSSPPGNLVAGVVAGVVDKARDKGAALLKH